MICLYVYIYIYIYMYFFDILAQVKILACWWPPKKNRQPHRLIFLPIHRIIKKVDWTVFSDIFFCIGFLIIFKGKTDDTVWRITQPAVTRSSASAPAGITRSSAWAPAWPKHGQGVPEITSFVHPCSMADSWEISFELLFSKRRYVYIYIYIYIFL